jgi:hypothetical protein
MFAWNYLQTYSKSAQGHNLISFYLRAPRHRMSALGALLIFCYFTKTANDIHHILIQGSLTEREGTEQLTSL